MKLKATIFLLSTVLAWSVARRPFVDPTIMRSRIYDDFYPVYSRITAKFNDLDDLTALKFLDPIRIFPDNLVYMKDDLNRKFDELRCGNCRSGLRKYENELSINIEVIREEFSYDRIRRRFEVTFSDISQRVLTPIKNYIEELRDYKSNYRNTPECWDIHRESLFEIMRKSQKNATGNIMEIVNNFNQDCRNLTESFNNSTTKAESEAETCRTVSKMSSFCQFLYVSNFSVFS